MLIERIMLVYYLSRRREKAWLIIPRVQTDAQAITKKNQSDIFQTKTTCDESIEIRGCLSEPKEANNSFQEFRNQET